MPKLTKRLVEALQPVNNETFAWDSDVKGFGVRIKPTGQKSFVLKYRVGTTTRRFTISKVGSPFTVEEARERARELIRDVMAGVDLSVRKVIQRNAITISELMDAYLSEGPALKPNKKASSWRTDRSVIECHIKPLIGRKLAMSLSASEIAQFQTDVANGKSARDLKLGPRRRSCVKGGRRVAALSTAILGAALSFGMQTGRNSSNPARGVELLRTRRKERFLSEREVSLLGESLINLEHEGIINGTMADAARLLLLTGCRKTEVLSLEWAWVELEKRCLRLPDSKTGAKVVPLATAAVDLLTRRADDKRRKAAADDGCIRATSPYVFPAARGDGWCVGLPKVWIKIKKSANKLALQRARDDFTYSDIDLTNVRLHDLRHSFASFAIADGASLFMVGKVLGHKQTRTTEIYAHLRDDPLLSLADRTGSRHSSRFGLTSFIYK